MDPGWFGNTLVVIIISLKEWLMGKGFSQNFLKEIQKLIRYDTFFTEERKTSEKVYDCFTA